MDGGMFDDFWKYFWLALLLAGFLGSITGLLIHLLATHLSIVVSWH
jgi:hypothetical protein